jgi:hypothetical protein
MSDTHSAQFASALRAAEKAWHQTAMLARARRAQGDRMQRLLRDGTPREVAQFLNEMAGPSFASHSITTKGFDGGKAQQLGRLVLEMAWSETPPCAGEDPAAPLRRLELLSHKLQRWIDHGEGADGGDLQRTGGLVRAPAQRLSMLAPAASAIGVCLVMLKAILSGAPVGAV